MEAMQFCCAECGTFDAATYVVTGAVHDQDNRTEVCLSCHDELREEG